MCMSVVTSLEREQRFLRKKWSSVKKLYAATGRLPEPQRLADLVIQLDACAQLAHEIAEPILKPAARQKSQTAIEPDVERYYRDGYAGI